MDVSVLDAIATLKKHPRVSNVQARSLSDGKGVLVTVDIDTNLPSTWKADGTSPHGVLPIESVEIVFPPNYPQGVPYPSLRPDFDASLPHINPHETGERIPPCISQDSLLEALHNEGFGRFVVQLVDWLEKAGDGSLINPAQGWEPTRRAATVHLVEFDIESLVGQRPKLGGLHLFQMTQIWQKDDLYSYAHDIKTRSSHTFWGCDLRQLLDDYWTGKNAHHGQTLLAMCWPKTDFDSVAKPESRYLPDTVLNFEGMLQRAESYGCREALEHFRKTFNEAAKDLPLRGDFPVYVGLVVRRPFHLIGSTSEYEILVYRLKALIPHGIAGATTAAAVPVQAVASSALLRRTSAIPENARGIRTTFLGCGSLGSKLVMHLVRAGFAPELLIDQAYFLPHNAARHTLTPSTLVSVGTKADKLAELVNEFKPAKAAGSFSRPVQMLPLGGQTSFGVVLDPGAIIVNTTGSSSVRNFLTDAPFASRILEACLAEHGEIGILTLEGSARNPSTTDLVALIYEELRQLGRLHAFKPDALNTLQVGVGCNSVTLPMSDARISMLAGGIGQSILKLQQDGLPLCGRISIGAVDADGMSVKWCPTDIGETHVADAEHTNGWKVRVLEPAHLKIMDEVSRYQAVETGGIIVGRVSTTTREIFITDVLPAPIDSIRQADRFVLGTDGRHALVNEYDTSGAGVLRCLGSWHSHLGDFGPSPMDLNTADMLQQETQGLAILLIRRPTGYSAVVRL